MTRLLSLPPGKRVLQIGCGSGVALPALARHCKPSELIGADISREALSQAARLLRKKQVAADLVLADARRMPFADGSLDLVVDFGTCYQVGNVEQVFQEIARILDTGGILVHETRLGQMLAHPLRSRRRGLSAADGPDFVAGRNAGVWATLTKR